MHTPKTKGGPAVNTGTALSKIESVQIPANGPPRKPKGGQNVLSASWPASTRPNIAWLPDFQTAFQFVPPIVGNAVHHPFLSLARPFRASFPLSQAEALSWRIDGNWVTVRPEKSVHIRQTFHPVPKCRKASTDITSACLSVVSVPYLSEGRASREPI
jgi:hypothetical protein